MAFFLLLSNCMVKKGKCQSGTSSRTGKDRLSKMTFPFRLLAFWKRKVE